MVQQFDEAGPLMKDPNVETYDVSTIPYRFTDAPQDQAKTYMSYSGNTRSNRLFRRSRRVARVGVKPIGQLSRNQPAWLIVSPLKKIPMNKLGVISRLYVVFWCSW